MPEKIEDIEIQLLLEALYQEVSLRFPELRTGFHQAALEAGARADGISQLLRAAGKPAARSRQCFPGCLSYLTVQVSEMFRDPSYFRAIREKVVPHLRTYPSLKVWIAGCSSGEELYSFVILFREEGLEQRTLFYATDINQDALAKAEAGIYDLDRIQLFTENHRKSGGKSSLSDYYSAAYGKAAFDKSLRKHVVFSDHSLVTDAVFAEMHLVSCRNVLIYFDRDLQDRALGFFKNSLARKGFLGLGSKESLRFSEPRRIVHGLRAGRKDLPKARRMTEVKAEAVVIGASAGALEALSVILTVSASRLSLPVLVVVHVPPDKKSLLAELFQAKCGIEVREAEDKEPISGGTVYFAPPDYHLLVETDKSLSLSDDEPVLYSRPSIDVLFESAADAYGQA